MAHRVEISSEIDVQFSDEPKAEEFFIKGDWKETFFTFNDLDDIAQHLAYGFQEEVGFFMTRDVNVEGFGCFKQKDKVWTSEYEEFGAIHIRVETDLGIANSCEIDGFA